MKQNKGLEFSSGWRKDVVSCALSYADFVWKPTGRVSLRNVQISEVARLGYVGYRLNEMELPT